MSPDNNGPGHEIEESSGNKGRTRAYVWDYFKKITGDDGLPKTKCTNCNKVYCFAPNSGTSTMRRHLRKCAPQPISIMGPAQPVPKTKIKIKTKIKTVRVSDELSDEARAAKKLKSVMVEDLQMKTDRELVEFIWMNKRNVGLLEQKLPYKALAIKEAIKCYEDEIDRRANLPKGLDGVTSMVPVKIEADDQLVVRFEHSENVNQCENGEVVTVGGQSGGENDEYINRGEEERAGRLQIVPINGDGFQTPVKQTAISILPHNISSELKQVSSVLSLLTSPNSFYTPQDNPLDQEAENAKQTLTQLFKKSFETIVGSPDEQIIKSSIQILIKNLHKLPRFQGKVIETLNNEFESNCKSWTNSHKNVQKNIAFEEQHGDNLEVLQLWQKKDLEIELKIAEMDADILQLKAELREKELTRESLVKQKSDLFDQSKLSIDEAKKLLHEMVTVKLQSDVAVDNMKELASKWERIGENFEFKCEVEEKYMQYGNVVFNCSFHPSN